MQATPDMHTVQLYCELLIVIESVIVRVGQSVYEEQDGLYLAAVAITGSGQCSWTD